MGFDGLKMFLILLFVACCIYGSYLWVASTKAATVQLLVETADSNRQERIKEMAEAILLADKMRGE